jgi:outer membrane receptor protein involved in Fe transport
VDLRVGYRLNRWNVSLFANNLTDERFVKTRLYTTANPNTGLIDVDANAEIGINKLRAAGLQVDYRW